MKKGRLDGIEKEMYLYFANYNDAYAPSFAKFARLKGLTTEELSELRLKKEFDRAFIECMEIRRDYLIDRALTKKFDASFVKFLIDTESYEKSGEDITVRLEVT